jgi:hypothetical protein
VWRPAQAPSRSPTELQYEETHNTLKYANRAKDIKVIGAARARPSRKGLKRVRQTKVTRNEYNVNEHIAQYATVVKSLREEVMQLKAQLQLYEQGATPSSALEAPRKDSTSQRTLEVGRGGRAARVWHGDRAEHARACTGAARADDPGL